jgi:hypothetical protein
MICMRLSEKKHSIRENGEAHLAGKIFGDRAVESHISPKTSEIWGPPKFCFGERMSEL